MKENIKSLKDTQSLAEEIIAVEAHNDAIKLVADCAEMQCNLIEQMSEFVFE
jgi:hypothetical protein